MFHIVRRTFSRASLALYRSFTLVDLLLLEDLLHFWKIGSVESDVGSKLASICNLYLSQILLGFSFGASAFMSFGAVLI